MKKNMKKIIVSSLIILLTSWNAYFHCQDLKLFTPILISNLPDGCINNEKVSKVILDYFNPNLAKIEASFFKYSSDENILYLYSFDKKEFKAFLKFNSIGEKVSLENYLGVFRYFSLIQESNETFISVPTTGNFPSHSERITTIEILERNKKFLIVKINYSDIYGFKGYGILIFQDYKY